MENLEEWVLKKAIEKAFGPVLTEIGEDLKRVYAVGRDKILTAGYKKIQNKEDGRKANLRVARDVFWNGAFTDDEICAEYFGGILAASRSEDGKDDSAIEFVSVIKSMSSKQLLLHYFIYSGLNQILSRSNEQVNVAQSSEIQKKEIYFLRLELDNAQQINTDMDFNVLYRNGLLSQYKTDRHFIEGQVLPYASARPTTYGVLLYAAAHNRLEEWQRFSTQDFGVFEDIKLPQFFAQTLDDLDRQMKPSPRDGE